MDSSRSALLRQGRLQYLLVTPRAPPSSAPVLCFLHGQDEGAPAEIESALTKHGPLRSGNDARTLEDFIIVAPQLPTRGDLWFRYAHDVREVIEQIERGDPQRRYLTGFSFGANGVFDLSLLQPDTWAALWAVDPTRLPAQDPRRPVWLSIGRAARQGTAAFVRALALQPASASGGGDRVYLDEGEDHVGSATLAYRDERIYSWLLSKRLGEATGL